MTGDVDRSTEHAGPSVVLLAPERGEHGLTRFASVVAGALAQVDADVHRATVTADNLRHLVRAVVDCRRFDVIHIQYTDGYWGSGRRGLLAALVLRTLSFRRVLVVTAHDFHTPPATHPPTLRGVWRRLKQAVGARQCTARILLGTADLVITCSRRELEVLAWTRPRRTAVVPHYVEDRPGVEERRCAANAIGGPRRIVIVGWIHQRKGQHWGVRVLPHVPDSELVLAGGALERNRPYLDRILSEASALAVEARVRCTGTVSDDGLDAELAAADVALAPYDKVAASGSISTLIAAGVPVVVRSHPSLAELFAACPTALVPYESDDPEVIAAALERCLASDRRQQRAEMSAWATAHRPARSGEHHLRLYEHLAAGGADVGLRRECDVSVSGSSMSWSHDSAGLSNLSARNRS